MARDLLFGATRKSWARRDPPRPATVGQFPHVPADESRLLAQDVLADRDVGKLGRHVETTFRANYRRIVSLGSRMPADERRAYGKAMRRWRDLEAARNGKYLGQDFVELKDLDDVNARMAARLDALEKLPPVAAETSQTALAGRSLFRLSLLNLIVGGAGLAAAIALGRRLGRDGEKREFDT